MWIAATTYSAMPTPHWQGNDKEIEKVFVNDKVNKTGTIGDLTGPENATANTTIEAQKCKKNTIKEKTKTMVKSDLIDPSKETTKIEKISNNNLDDKNLEDSFIEGEIYFQKFDESKAKTEQDVIEINRKLQDLELEVISLKEMLKNVTESK